MDSGQIIHIYAANNYRATDCSIYEVARVGRPGILPAASQRWCPREEFSFCI